MAQVFREKEIEKIARASEKGNLPNYDSEKDVVAEEGPSAGLALSKDGLIVHPQPTADPLDPLNWSSLKKNTILGIVMYL